MIRKIAAAASVILLLSLSSCAMYADNNSAAIGIGTAVSF